MILEKTTELSDQEKLEAFNCLIQVNDLNFNTLKVVEEMSESIELLVKSITKKDEFKPSKEAIVEELGDTILRMAILSHHLMIGEEIDQRLNDKLRLLWNSAKIGNLGTQITVTRK